MELEELEAQISYYASKYYAGEPEITDEQFDALVDRLRKLNPTSKVLNTGWGFSVIGDKVKHKYSHIGSLDKTKSFEDIPSRFKNKLVYISPKLDGLSAVVYIENGSIVKAVTRGDGEYGKDITDKIYKILGNHIADDKFTGAVRGELIINETNWRLLKAKYNDLISPRNFAAGVINRKELDEDLQYIDLVFYKVVGQENKPIMETRDSVLWWLKFNFKNVVPEYYYPVLNEASWEAYHNTTFEQFKKLGYGLDGLVLTSADVRYNMLSNGYIYDEVAFKFPAECTTTTIKQIEWELSRTQRLIPVALVEPVELSGAIVERATCNNAKWVNDMGLGTGAEVEITRSNEVIPQILTVLQPSDEALPDKCPICYSKLVWDGVDLKCVNPDCYNIDMSDLQHWCEVIGETDGLQFTIMKQYLDKYIVRSISELYLKQQFILNDLLSRKLSITESKILKFFEKLYVEPVNADKALLALNIPRLGEKTAKLLAEDRELFLDLFIYSFNQVYNKKYDRDVESLNDRLINCVKEATTISLLQNINRISNLRYLFDSNLNTNRIIFTQNTLINKYIAVTGALTSMKRKDFEKYIAEYGYGLSSNLKKCKFLVTNNPESGSTKVKQAKELNVEIITEENFLEKLNNL